MAMTTFGTDFLSGRTSITIPEEMTLHGTVKAADKEVIVLTHIGRKFLKDAYVCHVTHGKYGEGIYDMPNYPFISISLWEHQARLINGNYYIMVCHAEAGKDPKNYTVRPNWL